MNDAVPPPHAAVSHCHQVQRSEASEGQAVKTEKSSERGDDDRRPHKHTHTHSHELTCNTLHVVDCTTRKKKREEYGCIRGGGLENRERADGCSRGSESKKGTVQRDGTAQNAPQCAMLRYTTLLTNNRWG